MTPTCSAGCRCDCCTGVSVRTPRSVANPPGRPALAYRVGAHPDFFASMMARLSSVTLPPSTDDAAGSAGLSGTLIRGLSTPSGIRPDNPLAALTVRTTDDPAVAILDAWAVVLDVLTFYQERAANESYLRTATENRSVFELARLVGYEPRPPVGASVHLVYSLEKGSKLTIPKGTRVTSTPGAGQLPQSFETATDVLTRYSWNALVPRQGRPQQFESGQTTAGRRVWFAGLTTQLKPNDPLLLVFDAARGEPFRVKSAVTDNPSQTTRVVLQDFSTKSLTTSDPATEARAAIKSALALYAASFNPLLDKWGEQAKAVADLLGKFLTPGSAVTTQDLIDGITSIRATVDDLIRGQLYPLQDLLAQIDVLLVALKAAPLSTRPTAKTPAVAAFLTGYEPLSDYLRDKGAAKKVVDPVQKLIVPPLATTADVLRDGLDTALLQIREQITTLTGTTQAQMVDRLVNLTALLESVQDRLALVISADKFMTDAPLAGSTLAAKARVALHTANPDLADKLDPARLADLTSLALANLIEDTADALDNLTTPDPDKIGIQLRQIVYTLVFSLLRRITNRYAYVRQAGVPPDTCIGVRVGALLDTVRVILNPTVSIQKATDDARAGLASLTDGQKPIFSEPLKALIGAFNKFPAGKPTPDAATTIRTALATFTTDSRRVSDVLAEVVAACDRYVAAIEAIDALTDPLTAIAGGLATGAVATGRTAARLAAIQTITSAAAAADSVSPILAKKIRDDLANPAELGTTDEDTFKTQINSARTDYDQQQKDNTTRAGGISTRAAIRAFTDQLDRLTSVTALLGNTQDLIDGLRREQRLAQAGTYPRVGPWLDELTTELEKLRSDLQVLGPPVGSAGGALASEAGAAPPDIETNLPNLATLKPGAEQTPPTRVASPSTTGAAVIGQMGVTLDDQALQLAVGFEPLLARPLYDALANAKVVRRERFQGVHALRARAAPFGHNAQLRQLTSAGGVLVGTAEWPLAGIGGVSYTLTITVQQKPVLTTLNDADVAVVLTDNHGRGFAQPIPPGSTTQLKFGTTPETTIDLSRPDSDTLALTFNKTGGLIPLDPFSIKFKSGTVTVGDLVAKEGDTVTDANAEESRTISNNAGTTRAITVQVKKFAQSGLPPKNRLRLDAVYDKVTPGSFVVIERATPASTFSLDNPLIARIEAISFVSATDYGMPATKVTVLTLDRPWLADDDTSLADIRNVTVYLQSEPLELAGEPYDADVGPVFAGDPAGGAIELDVVYDGLSAGRLLIVAGERTDVPGTTGVRAAELAVLVASSQVIDQQNTAGQGYPHTRLTLQNALAHSYQRGSVTVYGNVVPANQGETCNEVLGAGRASAAFQSFTLKKHPLTFLPAPTPTGADPQIEVRVNGILWARADRFNALGPNDRGYVLETNADGKTAVLFGDGVHGARLPTGTDNVRAKYRTGAGQAGNVEAGLVNQLANRPLGVKEVTNPLPAAGGADREGIGQARRNVPIGLTALGRLVSVEDYQDFARAFAGIAKARAVRLTDGNVQRVHLTIAGSGGDEIPSDTDLYANLVQALTRYGDPALPLTVAPRGLQFLVIAAEIRVADGYEFGPVSAVARAALADQFGFDNREFAQPVYLSDVVGTLQAVPGVAAVRVLQFGTVQEKTHDGQLTPLNQIVTWLKDIAGGSAGAAEEPGEAEDANSEDGPPPAESTGLPQPILTVPDTRFDADARTIRPAEVTFLSPRVPDLLTFVEWKP